MFRRPFAHLAGNLSGWPKGTVPTPAILRRLDQYSSELVNGDEGGTWAPESPIVLGATATPGVTLGSASSILQGDIETVRGNSRGTELDAVVGLVLTGGAVPVFEASRTRSVVVPVCAHSAMQALLGFEFSFNPTIGCAESLNGQGTILLALPIRAQHRGATISTVDFRYSIVDPAASSGWGVTPSFYVFRCTSTAYEPLHNNTGGYGASGQLPDQAANASDYFNNGQPRTLTYTPNQNNTNLDPSTNAFFVAVDASGATPAGTLLHSVTVNLTSIASMQQE